MKKLMFPFIVILMGLLRLNPLGSEEVKSDDVDGSFEAIGYNNPVEINRFEVYDKDGLSVASNFTPQERYVIEFEIFDADTIEDIKMIEIVFYYSQSGEEDRSLSSLLEEGTTLSGEELVIVYERDISSADNEAPENYAPNHPEDFVIRFNEDINPLLSSWKILNSTTSSILPSSSSTPTAFTFEVEFQISRVAPESRDGEWKFGVQITDGAVPNFSELYTVSKAAIHVGANQVLENAPSLFNMNFYGELRIPTGAAIVWSGVEPGMSYDHANALAVLEDVIYIANGEYVHENSLNAFWLISGAAADGATLAALTAEAFDSPQQFAVRAGMNVIGLSEPEEGIQMEPGSEGDLLAYAPIVLRDRSDEMGHLYDFYYWLALSDIFQNAQYTGLVTAKVNNSVAVSGVSIVAFTGNITNRLLASQGSNQIYNWKDLSCIGSNGDDSNNVNDCSDPKYAHFTNSSRYILMNDLNAMTADYVGLGDSWQTINLRNEIEFDGNGHTISDLMVTQNIDGDRLALFGLVNNSTIENLIIKNATVGSIDVDHGSPRTGLLAAILQDSTVNNVTLSSFNIYGTSEVGALAGSFGGRGNHIISNIVVLGFDDGAPSTVGCVNDEWCQSMGGLIGNLELKNASFNTITTQNVLVDSENIMSGRALRIGGFAGVTSYRWGGPLNATEWGNIEIEVEIKPKNTWNEAGVVFGLISGAFTEVFDPQLVIQYRNLGSNQLPPIGDVFSDAEDFANSITFEILP